MAYPPNLLSMKLPLTITQHKFRESHHNLFQFSKSTSAFLLIFAVSHKFLVEEN